MGPKCRGATNTALIIIGSIVFLLFVLGIFIYSIWPWIYYGPLSPCYASAHSSVRTLAGFDLLREPQTIALGKCVSGLYLVNDRDLDEISERIGKESDFKKELDCDEGGKSYIIALPIVEGGEWTWNVFKWPREGLKELKERFVKKVWPQAICRILSDEREFAHTAYFKGDNTYCVDITKDAQASTYSIDCCKGTCKECGANPNNPGMFYNEEDTKGDWDRCVGEIS